MISVAVEGGYEPFSFISDGHESGFDVDFICRFARAYGYTPQFYEVQGFVSGSSYMAQRDALFGREQE